jgi:hypothetical protein
MFPSFSSKCAWYPSQHVDVCALKTLKCALHPQVGVTCNFNDVTNTRVEVRPDRNYLKQQLKAVEARVSAIQEKKRKLDARMSVLTEGLKVWFRARGFVIRSCWGLRL